MVTVFYYYAINCQREMSISAYHIQCLAVENGSSANFERVSESLNLKHFH